MAEMTDRERLLEIAKDLDGFTSSHAAFLRELAARLPDIDPAKCVKVRAAVAVTAHGEWIVSGESDCSDRAAIDHAIWLSGSSSPAIHFITAMVPIPQQVEVVGQVDQ